MVWKIVNFPGNLLVKGRTLLKHLSANYEILYQKSTAIRIMAANLNYPLKIVNCSLPETF